MAVGVPRIQRNGPAEGCRGRFIPPFGQPGLIPAFQWVAIGLLIMGFLWFRPSGVLPEPRHVVPESRDL